MCQRAKREKGRAQPSPLSEGGKGRGVSTKEVLPTVICCIEPLAVFRRHLILFLSQQLQKAEDLSVETGEVVVVLLHQRAAARSTERKKERLRGCGNWGVVDGGGGG